MRGRILKWFSILPIGSFCRKITQEQYIDKYLQNSFGLNKKTFTNGLVTILFIPALLLGIVLQRIGNSIFTSILAIVVTFLISVQIFEHIIYSSYELDQSKRDIISILILNDIWAVWEVTGSIFDLVHYIAQASYSDFIKQWQYLINKINLGGNPEKLVRMFFKNHQYIELDQVITVLLNRKNSDDTTTMKMNEIKTNFHSRYLSGLNKLSDLSSLIIGANGILPISLSLICMITGLGSTPAILIVPFITISLTALILRTGFFPFLNNMLPDKIVQENAIGWFLINFGRKLEEIDCQEIALIEILTDEANLLKIDNNVLVDIVYNLTDSTLFDKVFKKYPSLFHTARLCDNFLMLDVTTASTCIKKLGTTINENISLSKKIQKSLSAEKSRIKIIQSINAIIMGLLTAITPLLSLIGKVRDFRNLSPFFPNISTPWWPLVALGGTIFFGSAFVSNQLSKKKLDIIQTILNLSLYLITFRIGFFFINQLF